jgi:hypothetical protein
MKYLEELASGDCFEYSGKYYILSTDFKPNGKKLCFSLLNGFPSWLNSDTMVNLTDIFTMDIDSNIIAIKERKKSDVDSQDTNLS